MKNNSHCLRAAGVLASCIILLAPGVVAAHTGEAVMGGGFLAGFKHPIFGYDHLLAMLAVGIWGVFLGSRAMWVLPVTFPLVMAIGAVLGIAGVPLPGVEWGIVISVIALGAAIAFALQAPLAVAGVWVALFAIFHGYAHGSEMPANASAVAFAAGFVIATGLIHVTGIVLGLLSRLPAGTAVLRGGGALIAIAGCYFALQLVG